MPESPRRRRVVGRRVVRPRRVRVRPTRGTGVSGEERPGGPRSSSGPVIDAARRVGESLVVAVVGSAGLYLVGSVWTDAYYGRMSVDAASLDLAPQFVALQAVHALPRLLEYPSTLLLFWVLYRTLAGPARRLSARLGGLWRRAPSLLLALANVAVVSPLVAGAVAVSLQEGALVPGSILAEVAGVLENAGLLLLGYAVWLGWSQRASLVAQVRARRTLPIALVFLVYLLTALASTAAVAEGAAVLLMTGASDASIGIAFTTKPGVPPVAAGRELVLVATRNGAFYAVERQPSPPAQRPTAHVVPIASVDGAEVRRLTDADAPFGGLVVGAPTAVGR